MSQKSIVISEDKIHICHFTTVHPRDDGRIFYKQCVSAHKAGYDVTLVVADGKGDKVEEGVRILDIGKVEGGRLKKLSSGTRRMYQRLLKIDANIYQFHDPELLSVGVKLKKQNRKVVYDSHEDVPRQILYKTWLGPLLFRKILAKAYNIFEKNKVKKLDGLISVIEEITDQFICNKKVTIKNFPIVQHLIDARMPINDRKNHIVYVGSITKQRGIIDYINAMEMVPEPYRLILVGRFIPERLLEECQKLPGWNRVDYLGFKTLEELSLIIGSCKIGLSVLHAEKNYLQSLPTKGFEYMAAGLPLVMSDFDYWRPYFEGTAVHIKPADPQLIADSIKQLISDKTKYELMVRNAEEKSKQYSWEGQFLLLNQFYKEIIAEES